MMRKAAAGFSFGVGKQVSANVLALRSPVLTLYV